MYLYNGQSSSQTPVYTPQEQTSQARDRKYSTLK